MRGAALLLLGLALSGCLRISFDRCTEVPPHPECAALDAGRDAAADAGVPEDAPGDVGGDAPDDAGADDGGG